MVRTSYTKQRRIKRLQNEEGFFFMFAVDHQLSYGSIDSLANMNDWLEFASSNSIPALVLNKGNAMLLSDTHKSNLVLQLMGSPNFRINENGKVPIANILDSVRFGADAVSIQLNLYFDDIADRIKEASEIISEANSLNIPVLAMMQRHHEIPPTIKDTINEIIVATELGVDIVKVALPIKSLTEEERKQIKLITSYSQPVVLSGGEINNNFYDTLKTALEIGFSGICVGRNIFQSNDPKKTIDEIHNIMKSHSAK